MIEAFEGGCQCGRVRYRIHGRALTMFVCDCRECQKQSGSAFGMALWIALDRLELLGDALAHWVRATPSGKRMVCEFCATCGTRVFHRQEGQADRISVKPGTLDDPSLYQPVGEIWTDRALDRRPNPDDRLLYPGNPDRFDAVFDHWRQRRHR